MSATLPIDQRLQSVRGRVNALRAELETGRPVDAGPLAVAVQGLCQELAQAARPDARSRFNDLITLYDEIEGLQRAMKAQQAAIKKQLSQVTVGRQAARAYGTPKPTR